MAFENFSYYVFVQVFKIVFAFLLCVLARTQQRDWVDNRPKRPRRLGLHQRRETHSKTQGAI